MAMLKIIQGDDKPLKVKFSGEGAKLIEGFYFSSEGLNISKYVDGLDGGVGILELTGEETSQFPEGVTSFDITAKTFDGKTLTGIYNGTVCVHKKNNKI